MDMSSIILCQSCSSSGIGALLSTLSHRSTMYMSNIIFCQSQIIKVYEQYCLLSVTVHQCVWAALCTVSHSPSMCMCSIVDCESQSISVYEQYCGLWVTVHQCVWAVLSTLSHSPSMCISSIVHCESQSIKVYEGISMWLALHIFTIPWTLFWHISYNSVFLKFNLCIEELKGIRY